MSDELLTLITQQNELLCSIYGALLFIIGVVSAAGVLVLLYNFLRKFF